MHSSHVKCFNAWRVVGQKLICTHSCTDHLFSAQIQPKPLPKHIFTSVMQLMHNAMRKLQVWNQLLVICLNAPPRPTWGHFMHFYDQAPRPPPLMKSHSKGASQKSSSWGTQNISLIFRESGPVKLWRPPPKFPDPPGHPPTTTPSEATHLYTNP